MKCVESKIHKVARLFTLLSSKPKTRTGNKFPKAKAKDLTFKAKAKDLASEAKAKDLTLEAKAKAEDTIGLPRGASRPRPCPRGLQLCCQGYITTTMG